MKETRSGSWRTAVAGTTNERCFSALPAGGRGRYGAAADVGRYATWWSSSPHDAAYAWHWGPVPRQPRHPEQSGAQGQLLLGQVRSRLAWSILGVRSESGEIGALVGERSGEEPSRTHAVRRRLRAPSTPARVPISPLVVEAS